MLDGLAQLPDGSVRCCVTSPPYWGLRDYGVEGQIGLEATPAEFLARMVEVFRAVRRVLADDGTCWVNMGDCYATGAGSARSPGGDCFGKANEAVDAGSFPMSQPNRMPIAGLKPKDLVGMPWRLAFALQADGWWLRSDIIWSKPNPMPESVTDRPTKSHEYIFLLTKNARYYFDAEAVKEPLVKGDAGSAFDSDRKLTVHPSIGRNRASMPPIGGVKHAAEHGGTYSGEVRDWPTGRNLRDVWTIATQAYSEAHFATFPEAIPERCIKAGTSERGKCPACGAAWVRRVERGECKPDAPGYKPRGSGRPHPLVKVGMNGAPNHHYEYRTTGWDPGCDHALDPVPDVVLDPFAGSGTTLLVANKLGRDAIGCELNPAYAAMAERRIGSGLRPSTFRDDSIQDAETLFSAS